MTAPPSRGIQVLANSRLSDYRDSSFSPEITVWTTSVWKVSKQIRIFADCAKISATAMRFNTNVSVLRHYHFSNGRRVFFFFFFFFFVSSSFSSFNPLRNVDRRQYPTTYKVCVLVHKCLHQAAPTYLAKLCLPVSESAHCGHSRVDLAVPRSRTTRYG